jgi:N-methylhydantoinase A
VALPEIRANLVNLNTSVTGIRPPVDLSRLIDPAGRAGSLDGALRETRSVWFDGDWLETPVFYREKLPLDASLSGPAILEQMDATTVLEPGDRAVGDADGNIVIEVGERP